MTMGPNLREFAGTRPRLGAGAYVDPTAVVIGDVTLGDDVSIWPLSVLRGDVNRISIGARSNIQDGCVLHVTHDGPYTPGGIPLVVGEAVTVGHGVVLHACTIGNRCLIGMGAIVMDGVTVGNDVMIGAGALVPPGKTLEAKGLYHGRPARRVRDLTQDEIDNLAYSAAHYVRLKNRY